MANPWDINNKSKKKSTNFLVTYDCILGSVKPLKKFPLSDTIYIKTDKIFENGESLLKFLKEEISYKFYMIRDPKKFESFKILWIQYDD